MTEWSPQRRALGFAAAIVAVVLAAQLALAGLALSRADALALDALASALVLALAACAAACFARDPLRVRLALGAGSLGWLRGAICAGGLVALSHAAEAAVELTGIASPGLVQFDAALGGLELAEMAFPLLALGLGSAIGEEVFFRGLLQRGLAAWVGTPTAIAASALAFGVAHRDPTHAAAAGALGVYLGVIAARAGSIRPAIAAHAANNVVALLEKATDLELPSGPIATPATLVAASTLACVALGALRSRAEPHPPLQYPERAADERPGS